MELEIINLNVEYKKDRLYINIKHEQGYEDVALEIESSFEYDSKYISSRDLILIEQFLKNIDLGINEHDELVVIRPRKNKILDMKFINANRPKEQRMLSLEELRRRMTNISVLHKDTKISKVYLYKIKSGEKDNPSYNVLMLLNNYFNQIVV
jgi:hypothetical protein